MVSVKIHNKEGKELDVIKIVDRVKDVLTNNATNELLTSELVPFASVAVGSVLPDPILMLNFMLGYLVHKTIQENELKVVVSYPKAIDKSELVEVDEQMFEELLEQIESMKTGVKLVKDMIKEGFKHEKGDRGHGKKRK